MVIKLEVFELTEENLFEAPQWGTHPYSCKYCLYWEHPELLIDPAMERKEEVFARKLAWLQRVRAEFGVCGKLLYLAGCAAGYAQFAPAEFLPNAKSYPAGPVSPDAVLVACLFIPAREHWGKGLGRLLLGSILYELRPRGAKTVETFSRRGSPDTPSDPLELYLEQGFHVLRDDVEFPLVRLEL